MTVVLLILKILGIVLLALLALFVVLILLVLLVPVRYRARGSYRSRLTLTVRVSFLLHAVTFGLDMLPGKNDAYLRILGFKKILTRADNTEEFEDTIEETAEKEAAAAAGETERAAAAFAEEAVREQAESGDTAAEAGSGQAGNGKTATAAGEQPGDGKTTAEAVSERAVDGNTAASAGAKHGDAKDASEDGKEALQEKKRRRIPSPSSVLQSIRDALARMRDALVRMRETLLRIVATAERIQRLWESEGNRQALRFLGGRVFLLLKRLAPKKLSLDLTYSTGAPDTTGELLGVLALFPIAYRQRWNITPDFTADHFYVDTSFDVQGRIYIRQVLGIAISVLLDKNCRKLYNEIKNGS